MSRLSMQRCVLIAVALVSVPVAADEVTINPSKDNTLIEDATGSLSNALGSIFCGHTGVMGGQKALRLVMAFDVAANVPAGSTITGAALHLRLEQTNNFADQTHSLYRLLADWGEGTSIGGGGSGAAATTNDATWLHSSYDTELWTNPGGDYVTPASAAQAVGFDTAQDYIWSSAQLTADVQSFLDRPGCNFGWLMRGNESTTNTAKKFYSQQTGDVNVRPRLVVTFTPPAAPCPADTDNNNAVDVLDLLAVINTWGACPACPEACNSDIVSNNAVDVLDLLAVINTWGPCS